MKHNTLVWDRKSAPGDHENLILALAAMVNIIGHEVALGPQHLEAVNGKVGLRARYEPDGGITLWTYDLLEDVNNLVGEPKIGEG